MYCLLPFIFFGCNRGCGRRNCCRRDCGRDRCGFDDRFESERFEFGEGCGCGSRCGNIRQDSFDRGCREGFRGFNERFDCGCRR